MTLYVPDYRLLEVPFACHSRPTRDCCLLWVDDGRLFPNLRNGRVADDAEAIGLAPVYFGCTSLEAIAENFCYSAIADSSVDGV
jgi:hypothetical protein